MAANLTRLIRRNYMTIEQILRNDPFFLGFERIFDRAATANKIVNNQQKYPPYNIIKDEENSYTIELAVAGFCEDDFDIELSDGILTIKGIVGESDLNTNFVYKGIAARSFERKFTLADTVEVDSVSLKQGMLTIKLLNIIPDEKKPRKIPIGKPADKQLLTG
jgi:molecular chaperone IbpA